jgi:hypothetical protein
VAVSGFLIEKCTVLLNIVSLSPYGLPTLVAWIVDKLDGLNGAIKSI